MCSYRDYHTFIGDECSHVEAWDIPEKPVRIDKRGTDHRYSNTNYVCVLQFYYIFNYISNLYSAN